MAWTPPSPLDSIVLLGGEERNTTAYTAEIVPGLRSGPNEFFLMLLDNILVVFAKVEKNLSSRTLEKALAEFQTGTQ